MLGWIMFLTMCNSNSPSEPKVKIERFTDTVVEIQTSTDTIIKHHYDLRVDTVFQSAVDSGLNAYVFNKLDSLLDATITVHSLTFPIIDFNYKLKSMIEKTITRTITDSIVVETTIKESHFMIGASLFGGQNNFGVVPKVGFLNKKGMAYDVGYDLINKNIHLGFSKQISLFK